MKTNGEVCIGFLVWLNVKVLCRSGVKSNDEDFTRILDLFRCEGVV